MQNHPGQTTELARLTTMNLPKPECCRWDRYIGELTKGG